MYSLDVTFMHGVWRATLRSFDSYRLGTANICTPHTYIAGAISILETTVFLVMGTVGLGGVQCGVHTSTAIYIEPADHVPSLRSLYLTGFLTVWVRVRKTTGTAVVATSCRHFKSSPIVAGCLGRRSPAKIR